MNISQVSSTQKNDYPAKTVSIKNTDFAQIQNDMIREKKENKKRTNKENDLSGKVTDANNEEQAEEQNEKTADLKEADSAGEKENKKSNSGTKDVSDLQKDEKADLNPIIQSEQNELKASSDQTLVHCGLPEGNSQSEKQDLKEANIFDEIKWPENKSAKADLAPAAETPDQPLTDLKGKKAPFGSAVLDIGNSSSERVSDIFSEADRPAIKTATVKKQWSAHAANAAEAPVSSDRKIEQETKTDEIPAETLPVRADPVKEINTALSKNQELEALAFDIKTKIEPDYKGGNGVIIGEPKTKELFHFEMTNFETMTNKITEQLSLLKNGNTTTAKIALSPERLGAMTICLKLNQGKVSAQFIVENHKIKDMVEQNLSRFETNLVDQKISVQQIQVQVQTNESGFSDSQGQFQQNFKEDQQKANQNLKKSGKYRSDLSDSKNNEINERNKISILA